MISGYWSKLLLIDLTKHSFKLINLEAKLLRSFIGGKGLATKIFYDLTQPSVDPLGPENNLIFMTGPFAGLVPSSSRHSTVAKSPLTGLWASSDTGGTWGQELKFTGYDGIVVKGKSDKPVYLWVCDDSVEIQDARHVWGKDTYVTDEILRKETENEAVVACIGPAGERLVKFASIVTVGRHARVAGRAGLGAVMGSKNLKAIVVKGTRTPIVADNELLEKSVKEVLQEIVDKDPCKSLREFGTSVVVEHALEVGDLPIKNWSKGLWEKAVKLSGESMAKSILVGKYFCGKCVIGCGRVVRVLKGKYAPVDGAGPEYESIAALGSLCLVDDLEAVAKANELCNRYGMDTISTGNVIAFAMEAFEKNLISKDDLGGVDLTWGNADAVLRMINMICEKRGFGAILSGGVRAAAMKIGKNAEEFAIHVKGLELPCHDPRAYASLALGYATANRGACHLEGFTHDAEWFLTLPEFGFYKPFDPYSWEGKGQLVANMQNLMCIVDSLPICKFFSIFLLKRPAATLLTWLNAITGWNFSVDELIKIGERIFNLARLYNVHCGISRKDDNLPPRILTNRRRDRKETNLPHLGKMLEDYYEFRGWSEDGIPTIEKLEELEISVRLPPHLVRHLNQL